MTPGLCKNNHILNELATATHEAETILDIPYNYCDLSPDIMDTYKKEALGPARENLRCPMCL